MAGLGEPDAAAAAAVPPDLVELGAIRGAYGVNGWVRIALLGSDGSVLLGTADWWLKNAVTCRQVIPESRRRYGTALLAKWPGCDSKEAAEGLKGTAVAVPRSRFPVAPEGSFYWADLIGCRVVNRSGVELGRVSGLRENAGGQWLEVDDGGDVSVLLIPLVEQFVEAVDPSARVVRVDWETDW